MFLDKFNSFIYYLLALPRLATIVRAENRFPALAAARAQNSVHYFEFQSDYRELLFVYIKRVGAFDLNRSKRSERAIKRYNAAWRHSFTVRSAARLPAQLWAASRPELHTILATIATSDMPNKLVNKRQASDGACFMFVTG